MSMLRSLSDLFAQSTLRRSPPEYPPHVANAKIAKSCQKQTTFFLYFVSFQRPSRARPPRVRLAITPRSHSVATRYSCALPKYKEPPNLKLCCHTQTETRPCVCARHLSPPLPPKPHLGFTTLAAIAIMALTGKLGQEEKDEYWPSIMSQF